MDIAPGNYNTGTATVDAGGLAVSFQGVPNMQAAIRPGDRFGGHVGLPIRIASVGTDTVTLAHPWPGAAQTAAPYEIAFTPYDLGYREEFYEIIKRYGRGALPAMAELVGVDKAVPMFTGPQTMTLLTQQDLTQGARYDVQVAALIDRAAYDNSTEGFAVLVGNTGDGRAAIYSRVGAAGNWSAPAYITGPAITLDITEVDEVPYGTPPDVTLTPVAGGYTMAFDIPAGMTIEPGTTTTLGPGQPASVAFVPITGGYRLDISLPKGDTGDIDGVTPFWVTRLSTDTDAELARAGLGATATGDALITAADADAARAAIVAQEHLGWKPVPGNIITPAGANAVVIPVPAGCGSVRLSGSIKSAVFTYMRLSYDGGVTYMSAPTDYVRGAMTAYHTTVESAASAGATQVIAALNNGDAILPTQFRVEIDSTEPLGFNLPRFRTLSYGLTDAGAPGSMYRYEVFGFARAAALITHIMLFTEDGSNFGAGTRFLAEAF